MPTRRRVTKKRPRHAAAFAAAGLVESRRLSGGLAAALAAPVASAVGVARELPALPPAPAEAGEGGSPVLVRELALEPADLASPLVSLRNAQGPGRDQVRALAVRVVQAAAEHPFRRLTIASASAGDGRTTVTLNLACELAAMRKRVLVVDCDPAGPSVLRALGGGAPDGMENGRELVRALPHGFDVLSAYGEAAGPDMNEFAEFCDRLGPFYDFVLFDAPPLTDAASTAILAGIADRTLLVVRQGTSAAAMAGAIAPLSADRVLGAVINRAARR